MQDFRDATLLIIGHGSTVNEDSGATVHQHAAALRDRGLFAAVREAFWKIEPSIPRVLAEAQTPRVFVVPFFTTEGYFTQYAIPGALSLPTDAAGRVLPQPAFKLGDRTLHYCAPVGTHPLMTEIILARAASVLEELRNTKHGIRSSSTQPTNQPSTALVIAGHGTELNADSRKSIERQVELIAARNFFDEVHPAFLEEEPRIADIPKFVQAQRIVIVPFFMSDGLHVCEDIPVLLGETVETVQARLKTGEWPWRNPTDRRGKTIFYTPGVGSERGIADVILERVRAAAG